MTKIFERAVETSATHAFVIGVGSYPDAKPGKGFDPALRSVPDIASAADGARLMCDWLLSNQDRLIAPLASLEVLIREAADPPGTIPYPWVNPSANPIDIPDYKNIEQAGKDWVKRLKARPGDVAFFYICGHGARLGSDPVVFLTDLNHDETDPWGGYLNVGETATAFKQLAPIKAAFFFVDACQEFSPKLELMKTRGGARFILPLDPFRLKEAREKVALLSATSDGLLAYEGDWSVDKAVKIGRFTGTLQQALDGAAVRLKSGRWVVYPGSLFEDLKALHGLRPDWRDRPFEPSQPLMPNEVFPIVNPSSPLVPIKIVTDPKQAMDKYDVRIFAKPDRGPPCLKERRVRANEEWIVWVDASAMPHFAVAEDNAVFFQEIFIPSSPIFDQRITIR